MFKSRHCSTDWQLLLNASSRLTTFTLQYWVSREISRAREESATRLEQQLQHWQTWQTDRQTDTVTVLQGKPSLYSCRTLPSHKLTTVLVSCNVITSIPQNALTHATTMQSCECNSVYNKTNNVYTGQHTEHVLPSHRKDALMLIYITVTIII